jgi:hypothetical protein
MAHLPDTFTVQFRNWACSVEVGFYCNNNRPSLQLVDAETGEPVARATVNIPDVPIPDGTVLVKDWSENEGIRHALVDAGVIEETIVAIIPTGYTAADLVKLTPEVDKFIKDLAAVVL